MFGPTDVDTLLRVLYLSFWSFVLRAGGFLILAMQWTVGEVFREPQSGRSYGANCSVVLDPAPHRVGGKRGWDIRPTGPARRQFAALITRVFRTVR